jgi:hypothetical protein
MDGRRPLTPVRVSVSVGVALILIATYVGVGNSVGERPESNDIVAPMLASCNFYPGIEPLSSLLESHEPRQSQTEESRALQRLTDLYQVTCSNPNFVDASAGTGSSNISLGFYSTREQGLVFANLTMSWVSGVGAGALGHQEWVSVNEATGAVTGPHASNFEVQASYSSNSQSLNWAGWEFWGGSSKPALVEATGITKVDSMAAKPSQQTDPVGVSVDSDIAVWVGLSPCHGADCSGETNMIQTGYSVDASHTSDSWCVGFSDSCDYGLWWESLNTPWTCTVDGGSTADCPPMPYSGDPTVSVGDIIEPSVWSPTSDYYETGIYDSTTGQNWNQELSTTYWTPNYAEYIAEAPLFSSGSTLQIPQLANFSVPIEWEDGFVSDGTSAPTLGQAFNSSWYATYTLNQSNTSTLQTQEPMYMGPTFWGNYQYFPLIKSLNSLYEYCYVNLYAPHCQDNGGGCVAYGTPILTPSGYVRVQNLAAGDAVVEFNVSSGRFTRGTFLSGNTTTVNTLIDVNGGLLYMTPTDQPIFIYNSTFQGWLRDPQNLTTQDEIFDPVTDTWINVTSISAVHHNTTVYDVQTSGLNSFIANGILLDPK